MKKYANDEMTRKEESTKAPTPDKLDRSSVEREADANTGKKKSQYPLTEEEATPTTPKSEDMKD
ncbi:MAG: hypothetical protein ACHQ1H_07850 [Nitrososphaerales archaeon]